MNSYDVGDLVRVTATFTNAAGTVADPAAVTARYRSPSGTTTTLTYGVDAELVKESTGVYHVDISASESGTWSYRFASTGSGQAANEESFFVERSEF
jgi:hypothetical protein